MKCYPLTKEFSVWLQDFLSTSLIQAPTKSSKYAEWYIVFCLITQHMNRCKFFRWKKCSELMVYASLLMSKQTQTSPTLYILLVKEYYNQDDILLIYASMFGVFFPCSGIFLTNITHLWQLLLIKALEKTALLENIMHWVCLFVFHNTKNY